MCGSYLVASPPSVLVGFGEDTVAIIRHEEKVYSDPVTRFLLALYVDMDFDEALRAGERLGKGKAPYVTRTQPLSNPAQ